MFECFLFVETLNDTFNIEINFGDQDIRNISLKSDNVTIKKAFNISGMQIVTVFVQNQMLNIDPFIYGLFLFLN